MLDTVRRYVEAGREALTQKKAEELARALAKQGQARADQVQQLAKELADWSKKNSERLRDTIRTEVTKQLTKAGLATKKDVDSLKKRIRDLEASSKATGAKSAGTKSTAKKSAAKRTGGSIGGGTPAGGGGATPTA